MSRHSFESKECKNNNAREKYCIESATRKIVHKNKNIKSLKNSSVCMYTVQVI